MEEMLKRARTEAGKIIIEAGMIAKRRFDQFTFIEEKDDFGDVVTEVDHMAEEVILRGLTKAFPDHAIQSEEAGHNGVESDWIWLVDPLDGTNNFAIGLPVFSASIALLYKNEPVFAAIYEPMVDRLYISSINEGTTCNGRLVTVMKSDNESRFNIGWIQGHAVRNEERAVRLRNYIDVNCKRMMRLWAPTLHWCLLAKGEIDGIILYNSKGEDLHSGILMVKEAGGIVVDFDGNDFSSESDEPYLVACHPDHKEYFLKMVSTGLEVAGAAAK